MRSGAVRHSGAVRQILAKVGPLRLKDVALAEELRVVRGRTRRRLLLAVVAVIGMASLAGQPAATELVSAAGTGTIQIPVRWCALTGTTAVIDPESLGERNTNRVLLQRQRRATQRVWLPGANIILRSAMPGALPAHRFFDLPVIDDPRPPVGVGPVEFPPGNGPGSLGDIRFPMPEAVAAEFKEARAECEEEWDHLAVASGTSVTGPIAFNIGQFVDASGIPTADLGLGDFTLAPSFVMNGSCLNPPNVISASGGFMGVVDFEFLTGVGRKDKDARVVAHEFGHVLELGHGNGFDDDGDGAYDQFCDNAFLSPPGEDPFRSPASIMHPSLSGATTTVTPLQRQTSRGIAMKYSGSQIDPPFELVPGDTVSDQRTDDALDVKSASLDMTGVSMVINAKRKRVILSHTLFGLVSKRMRPNMSGEKRSPTRYAAFLDLDSDQATGGRPAKLGFRTRFKGAELVTRVLVKGRKATPTVWRFDRGRFADVTDRRVRATVSSPVGDESPFPIFDVVSAQLPAKVVGRVGSRVRLQAITAGKGKWVDVLPGERRVSRRVRAKGSVPLFMIPPKFPVCTTRPKVVRHGDVVTIKAAGFNRRGEEVEVLLGDEPIANLELGRRGNMSTEVAIPETISGGPHLVTVELENTALTADCVLRVRT